MKNQFNFLALESALWIRQVVWYNDEEEAEEKEKGVLDRNTSRLKRGYISIFHFCHSFFVDGSFLILVITPEPMLAAVSFSLFGDYFFFYSGWSFCCCIGRVWVGRIDWIGLDGCEGDPEMAIGWIESRAWEAKEERTYVLYCIIV
jgi:hypothetical protein